MNRFGLKQYHFIKGNKINHSGYPHQRMVSYLIYIYKYINKF
jgi:hypothetical protein